MQLLRAQVENYRSVIDSDVFEIDPKITCLVGKNESGKTTLLTALSKLNPLFGDNKFEIDRDYPRRFHSDYDDRHPEKEARVVTTWWELDADEISAIEEKFGTSALKNHQCRVTKGYSDTLHWNVPYDEAAIVSHLLSESELHDEEQKQFVGCRTVAQLKATVATLEVGPRSAALTARIAADFPKDTVWSGINQILHLPKFMLFSQYQSMRGIVSLDDIQARKASGGLKEPDEVFVALCDMAGTTIENVASIQKFENLVAKFEGASNKISKEIFKYWSQNRHLKVRFSLDQALPGDAPPYNSGKIFHTRIFNEIHEVTVPFDDRSTGFVWFFSFLALFSQVKKRHTGKIIILLDEPGLSLHGKAQADLLRYFEERLAPDHQVIYTTHSPFMVPPDKLMSARTVEDVVHGNSDDDEYEVLGTKVGSDVLSTDKDTLFPLQAALGYEITQSLFVGKHTLLVEGPSEILYFKAMSEYLRRHKRTALDKRWTLCPSEGISKVMAFVSLFGGNNLHIAVITDFASGEKKKVDEIRRTKILREGHVLTMDSYTGQLEADVEDLLGPVLYPALVDACYGLKAKQLVPAPPAGARVVKHVEEHFRTLPSTVDEFNHFPPSAYLMEHCAAVLSGLPPQELETVLVRFEQLFTDVNALLD